MPITPLPHIRIALHSDHRKDDGVFVNDVKLPFVERVTFEANGRDRGPHRFHVTLVGSVDLDTDMAQLVIKHGETHQEDAPEFR